MGFGYAVFVVEVLDGSVSVVRFRGIHDSKLEGSDCLLSCEKCDYAVVGVGEVCSNLLAIA